MPDQQMQIGVVFPQTEIGSDPIAVRDYAQAAEELGFAHIIAYDHVLGADTSYHQPWTGSYTKESMFHEIFVVFGYMAALTTKVDLVSAIVILGQRQTALVAKQAAEVDVLSNGRLRLGVGIGWNPVEYEALGEDFTTRGAAGRGADGTAAKAVDRRSGGLSRALPQRHQRRHQPAAGAAGQYRCGWAPAAGHGGQFHRTGC